MRAPPTPQDYADLFETHRVGAAIFEDLIQRFARKPQNSSGIDRILDSAQADGRRQVLDFIALKINLASGVEPPDTTNEEQS